MSVSLCVLAHRRFCFHLRLWMHMCCIFFFACVCMCVCKTNINIIVVSVQLRVGGMCEREQLRI